MIAAALAASVCVEEPGLIFTQILIVDGLLSGSHNAFLSKVEIENSVFCADLLKPRHQLAPVIEAIAFGVNGKYLYAFCRRMMGNAFFKEKGKDFPFFADFRCALNLIPAVGTFSIFLIILIGGNSRAGSVGVRCCLICRKPVPAGLENSVFKGIVVSVYFPVHLVHNHASVAVKVVPYHVLIGILVLVFQLNPAGFHHAVVFIAQVIVKAV